MAGTAVILMTVVASEERGQALLPDLRGSNGSPVLWEFLPSCLSIRYRAVFYNREPAGMAHRIIHPWT
jgi:hypothetical protein